MGLFDNLGKGMGQLGGGGQQHSGLMGAVAQLLSSGKIGGLSGLAQMFQQRGHGDKLQSWVSTGENKSISPEEVQNVLGQEHVREVANKAGVSEQEASQGLSSVLPQLVDKMTPDGRMPDDKSANSALSQLASRFLKH